MDYNGSLAYLADLGKFGSVLGLERILGLLEELNHPEKKIKTIHVTGTNGKGSVTAFLSNILKASGYKVGTFTSPHFVKYNERMTINGEDISDEAFTKLVEQVAEAEEKFKIRGGQQPTQFEVLTAMAFVYFLEQKVDYAVVEVGMGGLWDSTNVITPELSLITNVTLEHTNVLGKTVEEIAEQKAGIIKPGVPVVTAAVGEALEVIRAKANEEQAKLYVYGTDFTAEGLESSVEGQVFAFKDFGKETEDFRSDLENAATYRTTLLGDHQLLNAAVALKGARVLAALGAKNITATTLEEGIAATTWPGRLECIGKKPTVLLDGAHNPSGVTVLRNALDKYYPEGKRYFVFGMMADKDMQQVAGILFRPEDKVFAVTADFSPRAARGEDLARLIGSKASAYANVLEAYKEALREAGSGDIICVCGSLYLVGTFKAALQEESNAHKS